MGEIKELSPEEFRQMQLLQLDMLVELDRVCRENNINYTIFGGTLLGTGGLVRAYQGAVQEGLKNCTIIEKRPGKRLKISTDYTGLGKIQYLLAEQGVTIMDTEYAEGVELDAAVPLEQCLELEKKLTDSTSGKAKLMWEETIEFADLNGTIKVF